MFDYTWYFVVTNILNWNCKKYYRNEIWIRPMEIQLNVFPPIVVHNITFIDTNNQGQGVMDLSEWNH